MQWKTRERYRRLLSEETRLVSPQVASHRAVLVYPNTYHIGMSSLGYQSVYRLFNESTTFSCERAFLPEPEEWDDYTAGRERLHSLETETPLADFDIVAFSFSFEPDAYNVVACLDMAGLPIRAADRDERHPLVVMGGLVAQTNPEPLAPFMDVILLGDAVPILPPFLQGYASWSREEGRARLFEGLRGKPGVYLPGDWSPRYDLHGAIEVMDYLPGGDPPDLRPPRDRARDSEPLASAILTPNTEFRNMYLVEIGRGCPWKCNFCLVGHHVRPFKPNRLHLLEPLLDETPDETLSVGLVSSAVADHKELKDIMRGVLDRGHRFSLPSVNLNRVDEETLELIDRAGLKTLTVAPEAGTDRLREKINKRIKNESFLEFGRITARSRLATLKMYFLVGLPRETEADVLGIAELTKALLQGIRDENPRSRLRLVLSVNSFVPKPHTPFERAPMQSVAYLERCYKLLRRELRGAGPIVFNPDRPKQSQIQALISLGDRRVADYLEAVYREGSPKRALRQWDGDLDFYVHRPRLEHEILPWSHLGAPVVLQ